MILVTGATGFLGAVLARQLVQQGNRIRCTRRASSVIPSILAPFADQIEWVEADLLDVFSLEDALAGVTQVYNCAAWVSLKQADKEPMILANVTGTANLVNICKNNGIRMVHVSSVAAVGQAKPGELITENHHLDMALETDGYAISKLESEMEVWRGMAEGLNGVIVNPSIIIGSTAGTSGSGKLFETVRKGLKYYTCGSIGFVDVEDVARCMIALMATDITAERYIISAENIVYRDMFNKAAACFGVQPPSTEAKPWMLGIAWRAASLWGRLTGSAPSLDKVSAQTANVERNLDNSKIVKAIGIQFKPVDESVKEICEALKK